MIEFLNIERQRLAAEPRFVPMTPSIRVLPADAVGSLVQHLEASDFRASVCRTIDQGYVVTPIRRQDEPSASPLASPSPCTKTRPSALYESGKAIA